MCTACSSRQSRQQRAPPNGRGRHTSSHSQMSALSLCDTQWCAQNWCGGAPKTAVSLLLNSGCRIYAGLAQRQSGALVQRRSRFRNSHPAPKGDHAGRPGAYLNRGSIPQPEGSTPSGAGATEYAAFTLFICVVKHAAACHRLESGWSGNRYGWTPLPHAIPIQALLV